MMRHRLHARGHRARELTVARSSFSSKYGCKEGQRVAVVLTIIEIEIAAQRDIRCEPGGMLKPGPISNERDAACQSKSSTQVQEGSKPTEKRKTRLLTKPHISLFLYLYLHISLSLYLRLVTLIIIVLLSLSFAPVRPIGIITRPDLLVVRQAIDNTVVKRRKINYSALTQPPLLKDTVPSLALAVMIPDTNMVHFQIHALKNEIQRL